MAKQEVTTPVVPTPPVPPVVQAPNNELKDKKMKCQDCSHDFVWTAGEQLFFQDRQLAPPKRCPKCRIVRRASIQGTIRVTDGSEPTA